MGKIRDFIEGNTYYIILFIAMLTFILVSLWLKIPDYFYNFYKVNYNGINASFISFFGIVFGFLFTSLAILFTLKDDSLFMKLLEENNRNRKDIIIYFAIGIVSSLLIVLILLFLIVTYVDGSAESINTLSQSLCKFPIYAVYYLVVFNLINIVLLLLLFLLLLGARKR